ncbi:unnamed protein product [Anisakis simplex]|uniref:DHC_N2 domain-containing protein n=1 Tax=Anisakis simplex TaxID=6269 RepID=A0A0M3JVC7_ANISI|nr:unnamed protein product [Anisakis simplex]
MKREYVTVNETRISTDLARFVKPCNELWNKRSKMIQHIPGTEILHSKIWPNRGLKLIASLIQESFEVMSELEKCLVEDYARRAKTCNSPFRCIDSIGTIKRNEWIWAKQTWTRL